MDPVTRPIFSPALGAYFVALRTAKGWSQAQAIHHARKLPNVTKNVIWRLEAGKIKHPSREVLMDVATLYGTEYHAVAARVASIVYDLRPEIIHSSDLDRQTFSVDSPSTTESVDGRPNPSASTEERLHALEGGLRDILAVALDLIGTAAGAGLTDAVRHSSGTGRTGAEEAGAAARHRRPHARSAGARR